MSQHSEKKTHREYFPEQYTHPACGRAVRVVSKGKELARGVIFRVVRSQFGPLAILEGTDGTMAYALSDCVDVVNDRCPDCGMGASCECGG